MSEADSTTGMEYRPIEGFPGYRIGRDGSVWSQKKGPWKKLLTHKSNFGHIFVSLRNQHGECKSPFVHRLLLEAFVGPCPAGMECCHGDGNPSNNALSNLRWDTKKNNMADRESHGRTQKGQGVNTCKLTPEQASEAIELIKAGETLADIGRKFGVSYLAIRQIKDGNNWKHLSGGPVPVPPNRPHHSPQGEKHGAAKLTAAIVVEARQRHAAGESCKSLAAAYGVDHTTIRYAISGRTWKHIA